MASHTGGRGVGRCTDDVGLECQGTGSAYRLAQIVAAAALCLELSASASAASAGSENFAMAHLQHSGRA